ncbi:MAG: glycerate kinase [Opitutia bacterium]|nr:glycerate kinase [Opitutaceae bacterium]PHX71494.1 MAG: glycerate kinase [Opitutae bacterium]
MHVLLAFDKFKDSLTAPHACQLTAAALRERHPDWTLDLCPLADGGEGFCEILTRAAGGTVETHTVTGPRGTPTPATIGFVPLANIPSPARTLLSLDLGHWSLDIPPTVAVVEMATASGLALLAPDQRDPWHTTTLGTGELIRLAAARPGVAAILLGVGGSATSDLGLGALAALGLTFHSADDAPVSPPIPAHWTRVVHLTGCLSLPRPQTPNPVPFPSRPVSSGSSPTDPLPPIRIACDVTNPLLGPRGAAATYGPQKGLRPADLARLDHECARLALLLCAHTGRPNALMDLPGAGAAGGISFGLMAAADAKLLPGFDLVSAWLDLEHKLAAADLVITGEGRFDDTSLTGKGPGAVAARALALGKPVHVFAGAVSTLTPRAHLTLHAITPAGTPLAQALRAAPDLLTAAVRQSL